MYLLNMCLQKAFNYLHTFQLCAIFFYKTIVNVFLNAKSVLRCFPSVAPEVVVLIEPIKSIFIIYIFFIN